MNLIEQLGGYEKAKAEFEALKKHPELYSGEFAKNDALLLEHRRAHNIFENRDKIIFAVLGNAVMHYDDCLGMFLSQGLIRHATPEEIQAGRRLGGAVGEFEQWLKESEVDAYTNPYDAACIAWQDQQSKIEQLEKINAKNQNTLQHFEYEYLRVVAENKTLRGES